MTHAQHDAVALSHRLAVMNGGHIEQNGPTEETCARPANRFVAGFIGTINPLPVEVREATSAGLRLLANREPGVARFLERGEPVTIGWSGDSGVVLRG